MAPTSTLERESMSTSSNASTSSARSRDWLRLQVLDKDVYLESSGLDKYGRWLGKIHTQGGVCCNEELIKMGLALAYDGGTKQQELLKG